MILRGWRCLASDPAAFSCWRNFVFLVVGGAIGGMSVSLGAFAQQALPVDSHLEGLPIREIRIVGNELVGESLILGQIQISPGDPYSRSAIRRSRDRVWGLNRFKDLWIDATAEDGEIVLTFGVIERSVIEEIIFVGNESIRSALLSRELNLRPGDSFIETQFELEVDRLKEYYRSKGFPNVSIRVDLPLAGPGRINAIYFIDEGAKSRIRHIEIAGNQALSDRQIRKVMRNTRPATLYFFRGIYQPELFQIDLEAVRALYRDHGYLDMQVEDYRFDFSRGGKSMAITIAVNEGDPYAVGRLQFTGNTAFLDDELHERLNLIEGETFSLSTMLSDQFGIREFYQGSGYRDALVDAIPTPDRRELTCDVTFAIEERELIYISGIEIYGNDITRDEVIRRNLLLRPGDRFDGEKQRQSHRNLRRLQYFAPEDTEDPVSQQDAGIHMSMPREGGNLRPWIVTVNEGSTGSVNFGAGFSTDQQFSGLIDLRLDNFDIANFRRSPRLRGGGQSFELRAEIGTLVTDYRLSFADPYFLGYPLQFGIDLFDFSQQFVSNRTFETKETGARINLGKQLTSNVAVSVGFEFNETDISDIAFDVAEEILGEEGARTTHSLSFRWVRDTRDLPFDPSLGGIQNMSLEWAGGPLSGDTDFVKFLGSASHYFPLLESQRLVLNTRGEVGVVQEYADSDDVPIFERFFAGGLRTLRGYDVRDVGPKTDRSIRFVQPEGQILPFPIVVSGGDPIGGNLRLIGSVELKYRLTDVFSVFSFFDTGGVFREVGDISGAGFRYSVGAGIGIRIRALRIPMRLDYGFPLNPDDDQGGGRLHFSSGFSFR